MKQANQNSVDLLLRSLARGDRDKTWAGANSASAELSDHLDADELNLYAEGVLPALARSRYTEHLADCQKCRTLVVGLAQSAGRTIPVETISQSSGVSFWRSLATLFSLPVLRYALPAVLLTGLIAIGLLALREQQGSDLAAVNKQETPAVFDQPTETSGNVLVSASPAGPLQRQAADANTSANEPKNKPAGEADLFAKTLPSKPGGFTTDGIAARNAPESAPAVGAVSQPAYAPEPPPPPKASDEAETKSSVRKEQLLDEEVAKRQQGELKLLSKDDSPTHGPARSRTMSAARGRDSDVVAADRADRSKAKSETVEEIEIRSVSGRRFRREGNAWVDTAYQASRGATTVGRGSEQFRALMADEPGLRAIVQQLGGEVIVVWKNKVYRIR